MKYTNPPLPGTTEELTEDYDIHKFVPSELKCYNDATHYIKFKPLSYDYSKRGMADLYKLEVVKQWELIGGWYNTDWLIYDKTVKVTPFMSLDDYIKVYKLCR